MLPVSEVEIIENKEDRHGVYLALAKKHPGAQIEMY
jgi:hypothetical protein